MEDKGTRVTPRDLEDADPLEFQHLVETVWDIFEKQVCEQAEATVMLKSAAATISSIGNYKQIEKDFNLGLLGEYVGKNEETLPFLATVMSHIHNQLESELQGSPNTTDTASHCAMTAFLKELEDKMGADDRTKNVVQEIAEMANQASANLATGSPEFRSMLMEIGDTMRDSWKSLRDEVEKCIRHAKKRKYSRKSMEHIYKKIICKGLSSAMKIQDKIGSVSTTLDSLPTITTGSTDQQMNEKTLISGNQGVEPSRQTSPQDDAEQDSKITSPKSSKKESVSQISSKQNTKEGPKILNPQKPNSSTSKGDSKIQAKGGSEMNMKSPSSIKKRPE